MPAGNSFPPVAPSRRTPNVDVRTLRYFVEVVRQQSFTRAAENCSSPSPPSARCCGIWKRSWNARC
ncbi:LysR family transcriptional regulator [Serratia ureilytica]